jgi:hypothetical protein
MRGTNVARPARLLVAVIACTVVLPARAQAVPKLLVAVTGVPMTAIPSTATTAVAQCGSGTPLIGGGMLAARANPADPRPHSPAFRGKGSYPSDANGVPVADATVDPAAWSATANFGMESEVGDQITSLALCTTRTFDQRVLVSGSVNAPIPSGTVGRVTVTCPPGTVVVGGGAQATPPGSPGLKPVGMYPSDAAGNMLADGAANATSWTAVASTATGGFGNTTTAYAVCAATVGLATRVARVDVPGPNAARTTTTATVGCGTDSLIGGGVLADRTVGTLQQGVHLRGSYPSDLSGVPAVAGTADPAAWSAVVSSGGLGSPLTQTHVFALCVVEPVPPVAGQDSGVQRRSSRRAMPRR